jgi:predicted anti-sigma-YlaC factor YlaD
LSCQRARELIHPYIDGELDLPQAATIQQHIDECEDCKLGYHNQLTLRSTFKDDSLYYRAPQALQKRIRSLFSSLNQPQ